MNILKKRYTSHLLSVVAMGLLMTSCVSKDIDLEIPDNDITEYDGYALGLTIDLPVLNTRAEETNDWEKYEDYVDNFTLLFFNDADKTADQKLIKQYKSDELTFFQVEQGVNGYMKQWYVRIPFDPEDDADFISTIRDHDFKIAVLANWPTGFSLNAGDNGDNIEALHHLVTDDLYSIYYNFLPIGGKMGTITEWVKDSYASVDEASAYIRQNWDPSLDINQPQDPTKAKYNYRDYTDLHLIWNFGGNVGDNALPYKSFGTEWENRNGGKLRAWITAEGDLKNLNIAADEDEPDTSEPGTMEPDPTEPGTGDTGGNTGEGGSTPETTPSVDEETDINCLHFKTIAGAKGVKTAASDGKNYYGVSLPAITLANGEADDEDGGVFSFMARGSGTLYITAVADGGNGTITAYTKSVDGKEQNLTYSFGNGVEEKRAEIRITGDDQMVYIYNSGQGAVEIYQIEYILDRYLFETDRTGEKLSPEKLIPMYGIHKFGRLGEVWKEGTVFDLSNFNKLNPEGYEGKPIQLLRAVAKVEVLLPEEMNHVYMRGMNRTAYSEPVDVASNTADIWVDAANNSSTHPEGCEWSRLIGLDPFYSETSTLDIYKNKLSWYYGNWSNVTATGNPDTDGKFEGGYPHILNPRNYRSDFVEFHQMSNVDDYKRYILYVPEKFVDDPSDVGTATIDNTPAVCHIEFRADDDPFYNLDDNNCYRIYFTEEGFYNANETKSPPTLVGDDLWETKYENDIDVLKHHWTIMRNHIYTFVVSFTPKGYIAVQVKVLPWKRREIEVNW